MFIDDMKFRYVYLNTMKNVVWEQPIQRPVVEGMEVVIHPELRDVLDRLMRERPTWRYKAKQDFFRASYGERRANSFDIYDGDEVLGRLWLEYHWRDSTPRFFFDNFRLKQSRQRHMANYTTKPDMAAKRIVKAFHLKTPSERALDNDTIIRSVVSKASGDTSWPMRKARAAVEAAAFKYALENWETFKDKLEGSVSKLDLLGLHKAHEDVLTLSDRVSAGSGRTVNLGPNGTYLIGRRVGDGYETQTLSDDTLPDDLRSALGLLKLVEDGNVIPGIGVRANASVFFVMDKQENA